MPETLSVIGHPNKRVDATVKACGETSYADDIALPRMLHAKVMRSPLAHARVLRVDTSRARRLAGVKAVVTAEDVPRGLIGPMVRDENVLAVEKVRFVGDGVAAVAAVDPDTAEEALRLIDVEYEELPAVLDPYQAMADDAPRVHDRSNVLEAYDICRGDPEAGFAASDVILSHRFVSPSQNHAHLEPFACVASADPSGKLIVHAGVKDPFRLRQLLAGWLGMAESRVRVIQPCIGGNFGGKNSVSQGSLCCIAAWLSSVCGAPVKFVATRDEEMIAGRRRMPVSYDMKVGARRDGTIVAKETVAVGDMGAFAGVCRSIFQTSIRRHENLYRLPNIRTKAYMVYTNNVPSAAFRGYGNLQGTFAFESMIDMLAHELGMDPAEMRLKNATHGGDVTAHGWQIGSCGLSECIEIACEKANWRARSESASKGRGMGMSCLIHVSGRRSGKGFYGSRTHVRIERDGRPIVFSAEPELGQGSHTVYAAVVAEELGLRMEDVKVNPVDTDVSPPGLGLFSDRGTILGGNATKLAAQDARRQMVEIAADMLEARAEDLAIKDGKVFVQGSPARSVTLAEVAQRGLDTRQKDVILGRGAYDPPSANPDPVTLYGNLATSYTFAAQVVEVQVDVETGKVRVSHVTAAHDNGRTVNPLAAEGQVEGGSVQGLAWALFEDFSAPGMITNANLIDYKVPTSLEAPTFDVTLVETNDPFGPYGAKGIGEPSLVAIAPAVANAVFNATGVRVTELPITPDKLLKLSS